MFQDRKQGLTHLRYLLSADTREERQNWCSFIIRAIGNLRAWDPTSSKPLR